jgi:hypothetical protein
MALTRRGTHACQKRIAWETQMTRRGRGEAEVLLERLRTRRT